MRPFDPQLLVVAPAARRPVVALGIAGVLSGAATIGSAFAIAGLVVAVARGGSVLAPAMWVAALFLVRAVLAHVTERVELMTYVTCPILRYHPAVVAQQAATVQIMADGVFAFLATRL